MSNEVRAHVLGEVVDVTTLAPEKIQLLDIARTLSRINRYNGRTPYPYSVAQHAVLVSYLVPVVHAYDALHHDDEEAYIGDVIKPIKCACVKGIEARIRDCLVPVIGLSRVEPTEVHEGDQLALRIEQALLQQRTGVLPTLPVHRVQSLRDAMDHVRPMHYRRAEELYLARHQELRHVSR